MKRSTITVAAASLLALILGVWFGPHFYRGAHAGSLPELLNLVPPDSSAIVYGDLAALRNTPWLEKLTATAAPSNLDPDYANFVRSTGFAFERDLDRFAVAERPGGTQILVFAEGRFDLQKISAYAQRAGKLEHRDGRDIYTVRSTKPGKTISFTFLEKNRIAISDGGDIAAALTSASDTSLVPAFQERLSRVAGAPLFSVVNVAKSGIDPAQAGAAAGLALPFQNVRWISFAAQPEANEMVISAEGECDNAQQAQKVAATLEFLRVMLTGVLRDPKSRGQMPEDTAEKVIQFFQAASISNDAERVRLLLHVSPESLNSILSTPTPASPATRKP